MEGPEKQFEAIMPQLVTKLDEMGARLNAVEKVSSENKSTLCEVKSQLGDVNQTVKWALESLVPKVDALIPQLQNATLHISHEKSTKQLQPGDFAGDTPSDSLDLSVAFSVGPDSTATNTASTSAKPPSNASTSILPSEVSIPTGADSSSATSPSSRSPVLILDDSMSRNDDGPVSSASQFSQELLKSSESCPKSEEAFLAAAERGDTEELLRLLAKGANPTQLTPAGDMPLHLSARAGHERATIVLVGAGTPVDGLGHLQRTALHCAAAAGHVAVARRLLMAGAQVEATDSEDNTALILAAREGHVQTVSELLQVSAKVGSADAKGRTAAMWAAQKGHLKVLSLLLQEALPTETDVEGNTALLLAAKNAHWDVVELLAQNRVPLDVRDMTGNTALSFASKAGKRGIVKLLLQKGAWNKTYQGMKVAPLLMAVEKGKAETVRDLLWHDEFTDEELKLALMIAKDPTVIRAFKEALPGILRGDSGQEALWRAARHGDLEVLAALLETGVDVNAQNSYRNTALHNASYNGHGACVDLLLNRGALKNMKGNYGRTPLYDAAEQGHEHCVKILLAAGANSTHRNNGGKMPVDVAKTDEVRQLLSKS